MLRVPESCPRIALRAETGMMGMKHRIWLEKTMLLKRIKGQKTDSLSKQILEDQKSNKWPGLSQEVTNICEEINIPDIKDCEISAREIKQAVFDHHYAEIKSKISSSKKMMSFKDENFKEVQDYMRGKSVENIRVAFRIRCEMVQEIRGNYKDKYRRKGGEAAVLCPGDRDPESLFSMPQVGGYQEGDGSDKDRGHGGLLSKTAHRKNERKIWLAWSRTSLQ